jgi:hypothetical protein
MCPSTQEKVKYPEAEADSFTETRTLCCIPDELTFLGILIRCKYYFSCLIFDLYS